MMALHEAAQSVAWFAILVVIGIGVILFIDCKKEDKDD